MSPHQCLAVPKLGYTRALVSFPLLKLSQILIFPPAVLSVTELRKIKILVLRSCLNKVSLLTVRGLKAK